MIYTFSPKRGLLTSGASITAKEEILVARGAVVVEEEDDLGSSVFNTLQPEADDDSDKPSSLGVSKFSTLGLGMSEVALTMVADNLGSSVLIALQPEDEEGPGSSISSRL